MLLHAGDVKKKKKKKKMWATVGDMFGEIRKKISGELIDSVCIHKVAQRLYVKGLVGN